MHDPCVPDAHFRLDCPVPTFGKTVADRLLVTLALTGMRAAQIADLTVTDAGFFASGGRADVPVIRASQSVEQ